MAAKKKKSSLKQPQKVKKKSDKRELKDTLSIVIPIGLILAFMVGIVVLFVYMHESRRLPNAAYITAEKLAEDGSLIGLTLNECLALIGEFSVVNEEDGHWAIFSGAHKVFEDGTGIRNYELYIRHENDRAVSVTIRESKN
jgi:hypothetical protein